MVHASDGADPAAGRNSDQAAERDILRHTPLNAETPKAAFVSSTTHRDAHFIRTNFGVPETRPAGLVVGGAVDRPAELAFGDLAGMGSTTRRVTLECAGNGRLGMRPLPTGEPWRQRAVATAEWTGLPLAELVRHAGLQADAVELVFEGSDHGPKAGLETPFRRSLPVDQAVLDVALLAWDMNGEPLPDDHGAPLGLVVPGWYGMASVKWLHRIEAVTKPFVGTFQTTSYVYETIDGEREPVRWMRPKSLLVAPEPEDILEPGSQVEVWGWAWSGGAPIAAVDISVDDEPCLPATVESADGSGAWQRWSFPWAPNRPGRHVLASRATDALGRSQPDEAPWNRLGYGNNAVVRTVVSVGRGPDGPATG